MYYVFLWGWDVPVSFDVFLCTSKYKRFLYLDVPPNVPSYFDGIYVSLLTAHSEQSEVTHINQFAF